MHQQEAGKHKQAANRCAQTDMWQSIWHSPVNVVSLVVHIIMVVVPAPMLILRVSTPAGKPPQHDSISVSTSNIFDQLATCQRCPSLQSLTQKEA
jgi:hypothetical protein